MSIKIQLMRAGVGVAATAALQVNAASFELGDGRVRGSLDSVLNYGLAWRVGGADDALSAPTNGGNFNFKAGDLVVNRITGTHELSLTLDEYGFFSRAAYFYDAANDHTNLTVPAFADGSEAGKKAVAESDLLDAYIYGTAGPLTLRLGKQVISWGESTFIGGSLNDINTVDVAKLRVPGSELKEGLLPNEAVHSALAATDALTLEAFYLFDFDEVKLDPAGTFWNTATFVADGGCQLGPLVRRKDIYGGDGGQWGIALRYFAPTFLTGYDFGLYYMRLHSHNPYLSSQTGLPFPSPSLPRAAYMLEYPEGIKYIGASFNTNVAGWAWSGEVSHRRNAPVQLDGFVEAALGVPVPLTGGVSISPSGQYIRGWDRLRVSQFQTTLQRIFIPRALRADQGVFIGEVAVNWVNDLPRVPTFEDITRDSGGYQIRYSLDYNRALFNVINLSPNVAFRHDVWGVSSETGGAKLFIEGRKSINVGLAWSYLVNLTGSVSYTRNFGGDSEHNASGGQLFGDEDRQWISVNISYQF